MELEKLSPGLQIDENPDLHIKAWKAQPYAWVLIYLFVLAGLFGAFGRGMLSRRELSGSGAIVKYESALRQGAQTALELHDLSGMERSVISIPVQYLSHFSITSIVPEPTETIYTGEWVNYVYHGSAKDKLVTIYLEPEKTGRVKGEVVVNAKWFRISNYIFP